MPDDPFSRSLEDVQHEVGRLFQSFFGRPPGSLFCPEVWAPPTDVLETPEAYVVRMEIAGIRKEDIDVTLTGRVLEISGRRNQVPGGSGAGFLRVEIYHGPFRRAVELPEPVDVDRLEADYRDGFLVVRLPRRGTPPSVEIPIR